jgi:hypothetical protein
VTGIAGAKGPYQRFHFLLAFAGGVNATRPTLMTFHSRDFRGESHKVLL